MGNSDQNNLPLEPAPAQLVLELRELIDTARSRVAQTVNAELVMLHWHIGDRIRRDILQEERANYGEQVIEAVSQVLTNEYRIHLTSF
jgi:hypothetical protein